jgi:hypothetical protein
MTMGLTVTDRSVKDWQHFVRIAGAYAVSSPLERAVAFRGQSKAEWTLKPTLTRLVEGLSEAASRKVEGEALTDFRRHAHLDVPPGMQFPEREVVIWWAVMQHYGAPTRLLDWTESAWVAAYFAVERDPEDPGAVFILLPGAVEQAMKERFADHALLDNQHARFVEQEPRPSLYTFELKRHTNRMGAQQTLVTASPQILADHQDLIASAIPVGDPRETRFLKLVIPAALKPEFMRRLRTMNITARALFPGIDGLGRSVLELVKVGVYHLRGMGEPKDQETGETK